MGGKVNLELVLIVGTLFFGLILLYYFFFRAKKLKGDNSLDPILLDYAKTFFPILFIILVLRSFVAEPFRIPSGSMIPTLEIGDFILVKKYAYGIRLPISHNKVLETGQPKRGDVVVFRYPLDPDVNYIKRLIGLPGDHVEWTRDKKLIINGKTVTYIEEKKKKAPDGVGQLTGKKRLKETLPGGVEHDVITFFGQSRAGQWDVPQGHYFMMGDNRDRSEDGRSWGFVPESHLVGKASIVWMHWNWFDGGDGFQFDRIGTVVK